MMCQFNRTLGFTLLLVSGCALFGGGDATLKRADSYRLTPPASWKSTDRKSSDRAYETSHGSVVTVVSSCDRNATAPLPVLTRHLLLGMRDVKYGEREDVQVSDTKGLLSRVSARMEGKKFHLALFVVTLRSCIFDFTLISPRELAENEVAEFKTFVRSLKYGTN